MTSGEGSGHGLAAVRAKDRTPDGLPDFYLFDQLEPDHFELLAKAAKVVEDFRDGDLLPYVRTAYKRFAQLLDDWNSELVAGRSPGSGSDMVVAVNYEILCWLSMFRLYLDQTDKKLCGLHGKDSEQVAALRVRTNEEHEGTFAYRFLSRLRNYCQHRNLPAQKFSYSTRVPSAPGGTPETEIVLNFDLKTLLTERDVWGATLRQELEALEGSLEVTSVLSEGMSAVERLGEFARDLIFPQIRSAIHEIAAIEPRFEGVEGEPHLSISEGSANGPIQLRLRRLPILTAKELASELDLDWSTGIWES